MNDVRRFMRYTIPGLVFAILLAAAFLVSNTCYMIDLIKSKEITNNIGLVLAALLASGALGYVFSNIYFRLYWLSDNSRVAIDHKQILISLRKKINIIDALGNSIDTNSLTKRDAWIILSYYWYSNIQNSEKYRDSSTRVDNLGDITHSLGASLIGTILSLPIWISIQLTYLNESAKSLINVSSGVILICWILFVIVLCVNHKKTQNAVQAIANSIIVTQIMETNQADRNSFGAIDIYYEK